MFCKLDVRHKSIITLALLKDCRRIFCKSGPRITSMHWTQSAVSFLVTLVSLTKQLNWLRRCMGCGLKWDQETMYWVGAWTPQEKRQFCGGHFPVPCKYSKYLACSLKLIRQLAAVTRPFTMNTAANYFHFLVHAATRQLLTTKWHSMNTFSPGK